MSQILIVDDDPQLLQQLSVLLSSFGYSSGFIPKAEYLFHRLEEEPFDLILLDVNMPGTDGIGLLRKIKSHPVYKALPVIMVTGETDEKLLASKAEKHVEPVLQAPPPPRCARGPRSVSPARQRSGR